MNNNDNRGSRALTARYLTTSQVSNRLVTEPHRYFGLVLKSLRVVSVGLWVLAVGLWVLAEGLWVLAEGLWVLAEGLWVLAEGLRVLT